MGSIGLQARPPKFNGSTYHLGAAACIGSSIFTGSIQKRTLKPRKMSLITISSSPQQLAPKCLSERCDAATSSNGVGGILSDACGGKFLQVVLVSPQIPGNVGCIARTAAALVGLHLIEPLGFQVVDAKLKRAGNDENSDMLWSRFMLPGKILRAISDSRMVKNGFWHLLREDRRFIQISHTGKVIGLFLDQKPVDSLPKFGLIAAMKHLEEEQFEFQ